LASSSPRIASRVPVTTTSSTVSAAPLGNRG
jgi:hypothetical protein